MRNEHGYNSLTGRTVIAAIQTMLSGRPKSPRSKRPPLRTDNTAQGPRTGLRYWRIARVYRMAQPMTRHIHDAQMVKVLRMGSRFPRDVGNRTGSDADHGCGCGIAGRQDHLIDDMGQCAFYVVSLSHLLDTHFLVWTIAAATSRTLPMVDGGWGVL